MKKDLLNMLEDFRKMLDEKNDTSKYYIPILRDSFIPFLLNEYRPTTLKSLFCEELTKNGLIESAVYFVDKNENIRSESRLRTYLSVLSTLFSTFLFEQYPNPNLQKISSFTSLLDNVCDRLKEKGIVLDTPEANPSIEDDQFEFIMRYLKENTADTFKNQQEHIISKLYLLYGMSPNKLENLSIDSFIPEKKILKIPCSIRQDLSIDLELPYSLSIEIHAYRNNRLEKPTSNYLFTTTTGKKIDSGFLSTFLNKVKVDYYKGNEIEIPNPFTPTGLQKYAIVKMIESGMNQSIIMDFTGQQSEIFNDCQSLVNEKKQLNRNRYVNHMIRGIATYDKV